MFGSADKPLQNSKDSLGEHSVASPSIKITLANEDDMIAITLIDNGPGFPEMDLGKLLEPYVTTREKGTGLGLAIVSKIMEDHAAACALALQMGVVRLSVEISNPRHEYMMRGHSNG